MNDTAAILKSLVIYAVCISLALVLAFLLANPLDYSTLAVFGLLALILFLPLLLRWHQPLLLLSWNMIAVMFFLPGQPTIWLPVALLSLVISILHRSLDKNFRLLNAPQITLSLLCLLAVIVVTARMTGLGLRSLGGEVYGGKKYIFLLGAILAYFALSVRPIPPDKRKLYVGFFFLGGLTAFICDLFPITPSPLYFIYYIFPPNPYYFSTASLDEGATRFGGAFGTSLAIFSYMLARYGIRGIFLSGKPWRWIVFILASGYGLLGGFRGLVVLFVLVFAIQFFIEGLHKTKLLGVFSGVLIIGAVALVPLASHLPYSFQRALSFLPLNVSADARQDAQGSLDWRLNMWNALLPEIPQYFWLGKGYAISPQDFNFVMGYDASVHSGFAENQGLALADDYHSGPLSVLLPFGVWGCIAFFWFLVAGVKMLRANLRYGDPALKIVNTFLLAAFVGRIIYFLFIFGALNSDLFFFCGLLGLSVSLNGGVCRPATAKKSIPQTEKFSSPGKTLPTPLPAFQRPSFRA